MRLCVSCGHTLRGSDWACDRCGWSAPAQHGIPQLSRLQGAQAAKFSPREFESLYALEQDYFWFRGRADDVIKASGYRISPFEVESSLCSHPAVLEAAAVSSPDPLRGTVIKAFVVLRQNHASSEDLAEEIRNFVKHQIAPFKQPRKIEFAESLPKTTSGKIKRRLLREREEQFAQSRV